MIDAGRPSKLYASVVRTRRPVTAAGRAFYTLFYRIRVKRNKRYFSATHASSVADTGGAREKRVRWTWFVHARHPEVGCASPDIVRQPALVNPPATPTALLPRETEAGTVQARPRSSLKHKWTRQGGCGIGCRDHPLLGTANTSDLKNARGCAKCSRDLSQQRISDRECGPRPSAAGSSGDTRRRRSRRCSGRGEVLSRLELSALCAPGVIGRASAADVRGARTLPMRS